MNQVKQNRSEDHTIYKISTRIKEYGANMTVVDEDTADTQYKVSNRGYFSVIFELKACKYEDGVLVAPVVPLSQQLALFYSTQPAFICFYCEDYSYRVIPANYAAVVWSGTKDTKIMTEQEFQELFSSVSPCAPEIELNKIKTTPTAYKFFETGRQDKLWNLYDGFSSIKKNILWYNGQNNNIKEACAHLKTLLPEEVFEAHTILWHSWKNKAADIL